MAINRIFQDEINAEEALKKDKQRVTWKDRLTEQAYVTSAREPRSIIGLYEEERKSRLPQIFQDEINAEEAIQSFDNRKSEFTAAMEEAYYANRGEIPMSFWMEFSPRELRMFGGGDLDNMASWVEDALAAQQAELEIQAEIDARFEAAISGNTNRQAMGELPFVPGFGLLGALLPKILGGESEISDDELRRMIELQVRGRGDELVEDEISAFMASERRLLQLMREGATLDPDIAGSNKRERQKGAYERFYLSNGDPLSAEDHKRYWESEIEFLDQLGTATGQSIDITTVSDEEFEQILQAREQVLRDQVRSGPPDQLEKLLTPGRGPGFIEGAMGAVGTVIDKGLQFGGFLVEHGGPLTFPMKELTLPALAHFTGTSEQNRDEIVQQIMAETGQADREKLAQFINREASQAFQELEEEEPALHREYMRMAGLDPTLAMSFFQADLLQQITPEDQTKYLSDLRAQENERIQELEAQDFTIGDDLLHIMGSYGRNVPGRLSTMFTVMLTDQDVQGLAQSGDWLGFLEAANDESEKYGHTPSASLNIDGSLTGLLLDLGSGIAFDPTTWLFGPRLGARTSQAATASAAKATAKSGLVRRMADDVVEFAQSPSRGPASMYQAADWLDPISMGEFLNTVDFVPQALDNTPWRAVKGHKAVEVRTDFLQKLIPDELLYDMKSGLEADNLASLGDDIIKNGFKEPVELVLSRTDGKLILNDGLKRVLAAENKGVSHVPAKLRVTDDVAADTVKQWQGVSDDLMRELADSPDDFIYHGDMRIGDEKLTELMTGEDAFNRGGLTNDFQRAESYAQDTRPISGSVAGTERPKVLIFRKSDLPNRVQNMLRRGEDIEELFPEGLGQAMQEPAVRPVGYYFMDEGFPFQTGTATRGGIPLSEILEGNSLQQTLKQAGRNADEIVRPDQVLPKSLLSGLDDGLRDEVYKIFERAIVERGAKPSGAQYAAVARHFNTKLRKLLESNAPGRWIERYVTPNSVAKRYDLTGPHHINKVVDSAYRMWGDDTAKLNQWLEEIRLYQMNSQRQSMESAAKLTKLQPRIDRLTQMKRALGDNLYDDALKHLDDVDLTDRNALRRLVSEEEKALREALVKIDSESGAVRATDQLDRILNEMWEDYNREYIATNPAWADKVDPKTGLVSWEQLGKGKIPDIQAQMTDDAARALSDDMAQVAEELGVDGEALMQKLSHSQNAKLSSEVPVSVLELILARQVGASAYTRATHWSVVSQVREAALTLHRLWTVDKVFTPATAATVSFDELLRIFHEGGVPTQLRWLRDRATAMQARVQALAHGKGIAKHKGAEYLSPAKQERLRVLNDMPTYLKQAERQTLEQHGHGWFDIAPGQHGYDDAARQWTGGLLQDTGFRAFLRGEDDFRKWFFSPDGERLRRGTVLQKDGTTAMLDSADEFYKGWKTLFDDVILKRARDAGKYDEVRAAWTDIAKRIDEGGGLPKDLPGIAINHLGPIRGVKRDLPNKLSVTKMQEGFFDRLFMDPVNYRRGFLADLVRTHEGSRLRSLFASQGKRVVSDAEMETLLGIQGIAGAGRTGLRQAVQEMAVKSGYIPESYLDDLVEQAVLREIENTLYAFDNSSRLGAQARAVFPFGKPWADMAGYWGREIIRKPVLRGWINEKNALWLRSANEKGLLSFPLVPNRSAAMLSRLAHTDFTIDKGLLDGEGGLIPGSEETDFSPLFFLPTKGENPFSYMIPGLGILPIAFLDYVMGELYDPVNQPEEYQGLQDALGQFIPSVHFQQGGFLSRALGGGSLAKVGGMTVDISGMMGNDSFFNLTSWMGDISREIDRTREISALLSDPEELALLADAKTPAEAEALLQALAVEADRRASGSHLAESAIRFMVPVSNQFDASLAEIQDVWLEASQFDELSHVIDGDPERMTDAQLRQAAADVRSAFFDLDPWVRDTMVVEQPSLAVNMVGSWEWTPQAINENLEGTQYAYRTGGSPRELARHEALVKQGFVRPVQPIERARRIIGVIDNAKKTAAKELYTEQVSQVNELLWEVVPESEKAKLEYVLGTPFAQEWGLETIEEVWYNWRRIEEDLEIYFAEDAGIEPVRGPSTRKEDLTDFDKLRRKVSIDEDYKPWGATFPGLEEDDVPTKVNEWQVFEVDPKSARIAEALGVDLTEGMTGEALYLEVQQILTQRSSPVYDVVRPAYDRYIADRSVSTGRNKLYEAAQSDLVGDEFQARIEQFLFKDDLIRQRAADGKITRSEQDLMRQEFAQLMIGAAQQRTDWEGIWKEQFERKYGPLEWEPPEPKAPFDEEGNPADGVTLPSVRHVVDGDTLLIQEYPGSPRLNSVRLLGIRAPEVNGPDPTGALQAENRLKDALVQAAEDGDSIYLVRDERFGDTDYYGRMLAWLWIGDEPFYNPEELDPTRDPGSN